MIGKRERFLLLVVAACSFWSCSDDIAGPDVGEAFDLVPDQSVWLEAVDLHVRFLRVDEDSRCPSRAQCVWAGDGVVVLEIEPLEGDATEATLHTNEDVGLRLLEISAHELHLLRLDPYPEVAPIPATEYRVTLALTDRID